MAMVDVDGRSHLSANSQPSRLAWAVSQPINGQFGGVYAFGYNSAEYKPIWMKSGAL